MARSPKVDSDRHSLWPQQARCSFSLPKWLSEAIIFSRLQSNLPVTNQWLELKGPWQLLLESRHFESARIKRRRIPKEPLPGHFFFVNTRPRTALEPTYDGIFLLWLPKKVDSSELHLVACSRLRRTLHDDGVLIGALQSVAENLMRIPAAFLYSPRFTLASHLRSLRRHYGIPLVKLSSIPAAANEAWFRKRERQSPQLLDSEIFFCSLPGHILLDNVSTGDSHISSLIQENVEFDSHREALPESPLDWLAVQLARQVHLVSIRPGGNLEAAVRARQQLPNQSPLDIRILDAPHLTPHWLGDQMIQAGAVRWKLAKSIGAASQGVPSSPRRIAHPDSRGSVFDCEPSGDFLFHWTRAAEFNRRAEAEQRLSKLFAAFQRLPPTNPSFLSESSVVGKLDPLLVSLLQILAEMRLRSSGRWTRNRRPVVSLTAQPLSAWQGLRLFRSHLGRWDFEPCGLALSRELIAHLGGRPVIYGDEAAFKSLHPAEHPFFQLSCSRGPERIIDWTIEREWRVPDDIDLRRFGVADAFVFVPNSEAARVIARLSRWPVYALPGKSPSDSPVCNR